MPKSKLLRKTKISYFVQEYKKFAKKVNSYFLQVRRKKSNSNVVLSINSKKLLGDFKRKIKIFRKPKIMESFFYYEKPPLKRESFGLINPTEKLSRRHFVNPYPLDSRDR